MQKKIWGPLFKKDEEFQDDDSKPSGSQSLSGWEGGLCYRLVLTPMNPALLADQGSNPGPLASGGRSLSHWTTREVPSLSS